VFLAGTNPANINGGTKMPKKTKQRKSKPTNTKIKPKSLIEEATAEQSVPETIAESGKPIRLIRAIAVTQEILEAAKAYKRATGISFYQLGHDTVSERLVKEGFLNLPAERKSSSKEAEVAKP
jgi:hypothetical protein